MKGKRRFGELGEEYAFQLLKKNSYQVIERNFRSKLGEIDIIAIDPSTGHSTLRDEPSGSDSKSSGPDGILVFIEVKTRWSSKFGKPEEAVTPRKLEKIKRVGEYYQLINPNLPKKLRIDVVAIEVENQKVKSARIIKAI